MTSTGKGAPRKLFTTETFHRDLHTTIRNSVFELLPDGPVNATIERLILAAFGDRDERDLAEQREKVKKMEVELSREKVALAEMEKRKQEKDALQEKLRRQEKYLAYVFRLLVRKAKPFREITIKPEWVSRVYGVSFDIERANRDIFGHGGPGTRVLEYPDAELIEQYDLKKGTMGEMEKELLERMVREAEQ